MKKKLLIATDNFLPRWDGIARFLDEIIPFLQVEFDITVLAPDFPGKKKQTDVDIVRIPVHHFRIGDFHPARMQSRKIKKIVKEHDIIWSQTIGPIGGSAIYYGRAQNKHVVSYVHSIEWDLVAESIGKTGFVRSFVLKTTKKVASWLYRKCDLIIVPSKEVKEIFEQEGIDVPLKVIHLGVNTKHFSPPKNKDEAKRKLEWDVNKVFIGFHGRLGREKDLPTLHAAFLILQKDHPEIELVIIGTGIPQIIEQLKGDHVHLLGTQNNVVTYLQALDIYVLPSLTETTSLSTMEAMSCAVPVVTTPVGYLKRYILPGYNGYLFNPKDVQDLSKKIEGLIKNRELRESIGKNARKTIVNYYRWTDTVNKIRTALHEVAEKT